MILHVYHVIKSKLFHILHLSSIKNFVDSTYEKIKNGWMSILGFFKNAVRHAIETIELSKLALGSILDQIREKGNIRMQRDSHPSGEEDNTDEVVSYTLHATYKPEESFYPNEKIDNTFDQEKRAKVLQNNAVFHASMNQEVENENKELIKKNNIWHVSKTLNSVQHIEFMLNKLNKIYDELKNVKNLKTSVIYDMHASTLVINGHIITLNRDKKNILDDFQKIIPDISLQKLIAAYSREDVLNESYLGLLKEYPELNRYALKKTNNFYKIDTLDDNSVKIVITNLSNINPVSHENAADNYHAFGLKSTIIISLNKPTIMKYSYFIE